MSELCEHETFRDICNICHRNEVIARLRADNERLREEAELGYMTGFDVAKNQYRTMVRDLMAENERLRAALEKINVSEGWAALIAFAVLEAQPAPGKEEA